MLSKELWRTGLRKGLLEGPAGVEPPTGARNRKKATHNFFFNNPKSSILSESKPDPHRLYMSYIVCG